MFFSSLSTGMQMLTSLRSDMFYSQRHVLSSQGQPPQRGFEGPQPCQKSRHENDVVTTLQAQPRSGDVPGSFTRGQQDGVIVKGAVFNRPAGNRIRGVVLENGEHASPAESSGKVLHSSWSLLRRDVMHHVRHHNQIVVMCKLTRVRGKEALGG